jgi:excisionase family DNA binding protein
MQHQLSITDVMTEPETAEHIGISLSGLRKWRSDGRGPPYVRLGRLIRYRRTVVEEWLEKRMISPEEPKT